MRVEGHDRSARSLTSRNDGNVEKIRQNINEDRRFMIDEISDETGVSWSSCQRILTEDLQMKRVAVPSLLNQKKKKKRGRLFCWFVLRPGAFTTMINIGVLGFVVLLLVVSLSNSEECKPGQKKFVECNTCTCNEEGNAFTCTKWLCRPKVCEPKERKMVDCNYCICNKRGTAFSCTNLICPRCTPGVTKQFDCNICTCNEETKAFTCTKRRCPPKVVCKPGETKKEDCNTCTCNADGNGFMCTDMACLPLKVCKPFETKKVDCNYCICNNNGTAFICTKMFCRPTTTEK